MNNKRLPFAATPEVHAALEQMQHDMDQLARGIKPDQLKLLAGVTKLSKPRITIKRRKKVVAA